MTSKLLFVDDDEFILEALMRQMRDYRQEWDVEFASSGAVALDLLKERNFDLVVADMRMPHMDGIGLLTEVMHRSPAQFGSSCPASPNAMSASARSGPRTSI